VLKHQRPPLSITGRRLHSTACPCKPSRYVIIGASNRVTTLNVERRVIFNGVNDDSQRARIVIPRVSLAMGVFFMARRR